MRMLISLSLLISLGACSKPETRPPRKAKAHATVLDLKASERPPLPRSPSFPTGGLVKGKTASLSVEENIARQMRNRTRPLVLNQGVAGITLATTRNDSRELLSDPRFSLDSGIDVFAEGLTITWNEGLNPTPRSIQVSEDYKGLIKLPPPYGDVKFGQDLSAMLPEPRDYKDLARTLSRALASQEGEVGDDCFAEQRCSVEIRGDEALLDFPGGTVIVYRNAIVLIDFYSRGDLQPKVKAPSVFGQSLAGVSMQMTRKEVDALLGEPYRYPEGEVQLYDGKTIRVAFRDSGVVDSIGLTSGHLGTIKVGETERGLGTSFADLTAETPDPDGRLLMAVLAKTLLAKNADPNYDCTKDEQNPCAVRQIKESGSLQVRTGNMVFTFLDTAQRPLVAIHMFNLTEG
jgi:hypothetical protein